MGCFVNTKGFSINFSLCMLLTSNGAIKAVNPEGLWANILKTIWHVKDIAPETDALCRKLFEQAGTNNVDSMLIGTSEYSVLCPGPVLFIDEKQFNAFPLEQQKFLMGFMATCVKNSTFSKKLACIGIILPLQVIIQQLVYNAHNGIVQTIAHERLKRCVDSSAARGVVHATTFALTCVLPLIAMNWYFALEGTREGTKALDCVDGALEYLQDRENLYTQEMETATAWGAAKLMFNRYFLYRIHNPPLSWHIAEVEKLV
jgi:hypothetical protein